MLKVLENGVWVERQPVEGETYREYKLIGTSNEHFVEGVWVEPVEPVPDMRITKLAFKSRMTTSERIAIREAGLSDPVVFDFMDLLSDATFIDLSRDDTINGVNYLESQGHVAVGRASEILTNPIEDEERP